MGTSCPLCPNSNLAPRVTGVRDWEYGVPGDFEFRSCPVCGLLVLSPQPTLNELRAAYPPDYHGFHTTHGGIVSGLYQIVFRLRFREYVRLAGERARLLDVGCADAPYFDLLKRLHPGMTATGLDMIDEIAERGRRAGRRILTGTIDDVPSGEKFDLIVMNNLIEHVLDPIGELRKAGEHLEPGGHIILETPNTASWDYSTGRTYWGGLHAPRHTFLFSPKSLRLLAERAGFRITSLTFLLNTDHWALSVQNFLQSKPQSHSALRRGRAWYYKYLLFAFLPTNIIQKAMGKTGAMTAVLQQANGSSSR